MKHQVLEGPGFGVPSDAFRRCHRTATTGQRVTSRGASDISCPQNVHFPSPAPPAQPGGPGTQSCSRPGSALWGGGAGAPALIPSEPHSSESLREDTGHLPGPIWDPELSPGSGKPLRAGGGDRRPLWEAAVKSEE